jgi:SAM-dependent methyltransferase
MLSNFGDLAASQNVHADLRLGFAERLPANEEEFDLTISRLAAHHFGDITKALTEFRRVTKRNGLLAIIDLEGGSDAASDVILQRIEKLHDPTHVRSYPASTWRSMVEANGFEIITLVGNFAEAPRGITIARWCGLVDSPLGAEQAIIEILKTADNHCLQQLGMRRQSGDFLYPVRTCIVFAKKL